MNDLVEIKKETMSSLLIAEITGKNHKDVLRSIRNMEKAWENVTGRKFALSGYRDSTGKLNTCYELTKEECIYVGTKFNDEARAKIILRWKQLEDAQIIGQGQMTVKERVEMKYVAIENSARLMNLPKVSIAQMVNVVNAQLGAPLIEYTESKGATNSATMLLKKYNAGMSVIEFNKRLLALGYLVKMERKSTTSPNKIKTFLSITHKGDEYGINLNSPKNPNETQPHWYDEKFPELLSLIS